MNVVEIERAISELTLQPFDAAERDLRRPAGKPRQRPGTPSRTLLDGTSKSGPEGPLQLVDFAGYLGGRCRVRT
ncbi:MAG: hypothetical protein ACKO5J_01605, partial [Rubrivivax sp.]